MTGQKGGFMDDLINRKNEHLKTDQNALLEEFISRKAAIEAFDNLEWFHQNVNKDMVSGANSAEHQAWYKADDVYRVLEQLPSAQPETHEKRTETHACDCISRQSAIDYCYQLINVEHQQGSDEMNYGQERVNQTETILYHLELMPSVQPEHTNSCYTNSWCIDCKEYDTENKCCPRYNRVIKQTLDDAYRHGETEAEARFHAEIVRCKDCNHWSRESICDGFCSEDCMRHDEDFYCGYAERKTNE